jgi:hypothetical protein
MQKTAFYALFIFIFLFLPRLTLAQDEDIYNHIYNHDGSLVLVHHARAEVSISYIQPTQTMVALGVEKNSPAFVGGMNMKTGEIEGIAYKYAGLCDHFPFKVTGYFTGADEWVLKLRGNAPVINSNTCEVVRYVPVILDYHRPE